MSLKISLYSPELFETNDDVDIIFEVTNTANHAVSILKWFTPLEGLRSSCLLIKSGNKIIRYEGIKVKRGEPDQESFLEIEPGESVSQKISLEEAYNLPLSGNIKVKFDLNMVFAIDDLKKNIKIVSQYNRLKINQLAAVGCVFKLNRKNKKVMTFGAKMQGAKVSKLKTNALKEPKVKDMSTDEAKKIKTAHSNGYALAKAALTSLANDPKYVKWFGAHNAARFAEVKRVFGKVKSGLEAVEFTYINNGPSCESKDIAYTADGSDKIWLCKGFWSLGATGVDSQAGTIVHEHSHTSGFTDDHEYGIAKCVQLAKDDPEKAIDNGDSYQFYSET